MGALNSGRRTRLSQPINGPDRNTNPGFRWAIGEGLNFDVDGFFLTYNRRIGTIAFVDPETGISYPLRTKVADSEHRGIETCLGISPLKIANGHELAKDDKRFKKQLSEQLQQ